MELIKHVEIVESNSIANGAFFEEKKVEIENVLFRIFLGDGGALNSFVSESMDPSKRDNNYAQWGNTIKFKSNSKVVVRSKFVPNENNMDSDFYNNDYAGTEHQYTDVEGMVVSLNDEIANLDNLIDIFRYFSNIYNNGFQTLAIASEDNDPSYTSVNLDYKDGETTIWYGVQIKFTDENWWKVRAGENINIGTIHVIVEAVDNF